MNYHFSSPDLEEPYVVDKLSIKEDCKSSFSRISCKINELQLCDNFAQKFRKDSLDERKLLACVGIKNFSSAQL